MNGFDPIHSKSLTGRAFLKGGLTEENYKEALKDVSDELKEGLKNRKPWDPIASGGKMSPITYTEDIPNKPQRELEEAIKVIFEAIKEIHQEIKELKKPSRIKIYQMEDLKKYER